MLSCDILPLPLHTNSERLNIQTVYFAPTVA